MSKKIQDNVKLKRKKKHFNHTMAYNEGEGKAFTKPPADLMCLCWIRQMNRGDYLYY